MNDLQYLALQYQIYGLLRYAYTVWRPWGLMLYRPDAPEVHDLNHALILEPDLADEAVEEILYFYKNRELTPRVYYAGELKRTQAVLEKAGFAFEYNPIDRFHLKEGNELPVSGSDVRHVRELSLQLEMLLLDGEGPWAVDLYRLTEGNDCLYFALYVDDRPVSILNITQHDGIAMLEGVKTLSTERGKGYASALVGSVVDRYDRSIPLLLDTNNPIARRIYERAGFRFLTRADNFNAYRA